MTVRGIAEKAGVSIGTVDRVIHNRGRVSPETRDKILGIIAESGYTPNPIARHLKLNKKHTFAVVMPAPYEDSSYWQVACAGMQKAQKELAAFGVGIKKLEFNRYRRQSFAKVIASFNPENFSGLLMAPVLPEESSALLATLPKDYPVVFFDAQLPNYKPLCYIGQNAFQSGVIAGRLLEAFSRRQGPYVIVSTHSEDFHIQKRIEGFRSYFAPKNYTIEIREGFDIEHKEQCEALVRRITMEFPNMDGIFVTNASAHGIASAINTRPGRDHVTVVGYDLVHDNISELQKGTIDCILSQRQDLQGYRGIYQLYSKIVLGQDVDSTIEMPIDIYLKENLMQGPFVEFENSAVSPCGASAAGFEKIAQ